MTEEDVKSSRSDRLIVHIATLRSLDDAETVSEAVGFSGGRVTAVWRRHRAPQERS